MVMWEEGRLVFKDVWMLFWGYSARVLAAGEKFFSVVVGSQNSCKGLLVSYLILHF